jgi:hypothetical protein
MASLAHGFIQLFGLPLRAQVTRPDRDGVTLKLAREVIHTPRLTESHTDASFLAPENLAGPLETGGLYRRACQILS